MRVCLKRSQEKSWGLFEDSLLDLFFSQNDFFFTWYQVWKKNLCLIKYLTFAINILKVDLENRFQRWKLSVQPQLWKIH